MATVYNEVEEFFLKYKQEVRRTVEQLGVKDMPMVTEQLFSIYENTGSRLEYEGIYFLRRKYLASYGLLGIMNKNSNTENNTRSIIRELEYIIHSICEEEFWGLPAHVNRKEIDWKISIDLFAAETGASLAEIMYELEEELSETIKNRIKKELHRRILTPFYISRVPYGGWEVANHNWAAVCGGAIGLITLYLKHELDDVEDKLLRINDCMNSYIKGYTEDGVCMEGLLYLTYGMTYYIGYGELLHQIYPSLARELFEEKVKSIAKFQKNSYFTYGNTLCFSDSSEQEKYRLGIFLKLSKRYKENLIAPIKYGASFNFDTCYRFAGLYRDYIWTKEYLEINLPNETPYWMEEDQNAIGKQINYLNSQWSILESRNGVGIAVKGGHNQEPHNHNDVGSFHSFYKGHMLLLDLGAGKYTKEYFSSGRYEFLTNRSLGHNVPIINRKEQLCGLSHKANTYEYDQLGNVIIEFHDAYEKNTINKLRRELSMEIDTGICVLKDSFIPTNHTFSIVENFICKEKPIINEKEILILYETKGCKLLIETEIGNVEVIEELYFNHSGLVTKVHRIEIELLLNRTDSRETIEYIMKIEPIDQV